MSFEIQITSESLAAINASADRLAKVTRVEKDLDAITATASVKEAKTLVAVVHDQRMAVTRQIDAAKKACMAKEKEITSALSAEIERVSSLCTAYLAEKARAQEEAARIERERLAAEQAAVEEAARAEAALTGVEVKVPTIAPAEQQKQKIVDGVSARTTWTFIITDPAAIPRAYCVPDSTLIRAYMVEAKRNGATIESLNIPGVVFSKQISI